MLDKDFQVFVVVEEAGGIVVEEVVRHGGGGGSQNERGWQLFFEANDEDIKKREPKRSRLRLSALLDLVMLG